MRVLELVDLMVLMTVVLMADTMAARKVEMMVVKRVVTMVV